MENFYRFLMSNSVKYGKIVRLCNKQINSRKQKGDKDFMEPIDVGIYSLLPPLIAITLCPHHKRSHFFPHAGDPFRRRNLLCLYGRRSWIWWPFPLRSWQRLSAHRINLTSSSFLALLGALVCVVTKAGGSQAYGAWATQKIPQQTVRRTCHQFSRCAHLHR